MSDAYQTLLKLGSNHSSHTYTSPNVPVDFLQLAFVNNPDRSPLPGPYHADLRLVPPESGKPVSGTRLFLWLGLGIGVGDSDKRSDGDIGEWDNLGLAEDLPAKVRDGGEEDGKVAAEKGRNVPIAIQLLVSPMNSPSQNDTYKDVESTSDEDQAAAPDGDLGEVRLAREFVRERVRADPLSLHRLAHAPAANANDDPDDERVGRIEVGEPFKRLGCAAGTERHECEQLEGALERHGDPGDAKPGHTGKHAGCATFERQSVEGPRTGEHTVIAGRPCRGQDDTVDDGGQSLDACALSRNGKGGSLGVAGVRCNGGIVGRDDETDDKDGQQIKDADAVKDTLASFGNVAARVLGLGCGDSDGLDTGVGVDGIDEGDPEASLSVRETKLTTYELAACRIQKVISDAHRPGVLPIVEAYTLAAGNTTQVVDETKQDATEDEGDFEEGGDEFHFTVDTDEKDVDHKGEDYR